MISFDEMQDIINIAKTYENKGQIFVDDLKTEFILTNKKFETLK